MPPTPDIRTIPFDRTKYGHRLMVDAARIGELPGMHLGDEPHRLDFYDILVMRTTGGHFRLDEVEIPVERHRLVVTTPGQVRQWLLSRRQQQTFDGDVLFFLGSFATDFFNDPWFLHRLHYFHRHRGVATVKLKASEADWFSRRLRAMRHELIDFRDDSEHLLRAVLYEVLIRSNRWYATHLGIEPDAIGSGLVTRFLELLNAPSARRDVSWHARQLGVSTTHLRNEVRRALETTPGRLVRAGIACEAKRRLLFTTATASTIAEDLGFPDPSYFSRFLRRETGCGPSDLRRSWPAGSVVG